MCCRTSCTGYHTIWESVRSFYSCLERIKNLTKKHGLQDGFESATTALDEEEDEVVQDEDVAASEDGMQ